MDLIFGVWTHQPLWVISIKRCIHVQYGSLNKVPFRTAADVYNVPFLSLFSGNIILDTFYAYTIHMKYKVSFSSNFKKEVTKFVVIGPLRGKTQRSVL